MALENRFGPPGTKPDLAAEIQARQVGLEADRNDATGVDVHKWFRVDDPEQPGLCAKVLTWEERMNLCQNLDNEDRKPGMTILEALTSPSPAVGKADAQAVDGEKQQVGTEPKEEESREDTMSVTVGGSEYDGEAVMSD